MLTVRIAANYSVPFDKGNRVTVAKVCAFDEQLNVLIKSKTVIMVQYPLVFDFFIQSRIYDALHEKTGLF